MMCMSKLLKPLHLFQKMELWDLYGHQEKFLQHALIAMSILNYTACSIAGRGPHCSNADNSLLLNMIIVLS